MYTHSVTVAGRPLSDFGAKMLAYPEITSCETDAEIFQGANRSSFQLLQNRRGAKYMTFNIDYMSADPFTRAFNRSSFEALFTGTEPVLIDIGDGFVYKAVLVATKDCGTVSELISTVEYRCRVTRNMADVVATIGRRAHILCTSNVPITDCKIYIPGGQIYADEHNFEITLNGLSWVLPDGTTGNILIDGINKVFMIGGVNAMSLITWTDFPYLIPGDNFISAGAEGHGSTLTMAVRYTPTFL